MTNSYFKVTRKISERRHIDAYVFFDERDEKDVRSAHNHAVTLWSKTGGRLSVYRTPIARGSWTTVDVVGEAA